MVACGIYDVWLSLCMYPGRSCHRRLFEIFGSAYDVYSADSAAVEAAGLPAGVASRINDKSLDRAVAIMDYCTRAGVAIVTGDTKVVPRGACDKIFINTAGIGTIIRQPATAQNPAMRCS